MKNGIYGNFVRNILIVLVALICIIYPVKVLSLGFFHHLLKDGQYHKMLFELIAWFGLALLGIKKKNIIWILSLLLLFCYLHVMLLPVVVAGIYTLLTILIGRYLNNYFLKYEANDSVLIDYFLGILFLTISYAFLSVLKLGSIKNVRLYCILLFFYICVSIYKRKIIITKFEMKNFNVSSTNYIKYCILMIFFMLMIGRANYSLDYDSVWYGLRSPFVLSHREGIYENLNMVGCVYSYSKGYEVYSLPLADTYSYGFMYAGNIFLLFALLYIVYKIAEKFLDNDSALWIVVFIAAIPGISNMAITAKSDIMTLFVQMLCLYYALQYVMHKNRIYIGLVISTFIISQTLKPTSTVFSSTILILLFFICVVYRIKIKFDKAAIGLICFSTIGLALIWSRTYILTGIPATSIWGSLFKLMGMSNKYPYSSGAAFQFRTSDLFSREVLYSTIIRIKEFFLAPNSADTDHVIIAWGSTLCTFIAIMIFLGIIFNLKEVINSLRQNATSGFMGLLFLGEFLGCLLSLLLLIKPDGNYFMLYYCSTILVGIIFLKNKLIINNTFNKCIIRGIFICFIPLNICLTGAVNWAWVSRFNEIEWVNKGYYNHRQEFEDIVKDEGCNNIYYILTADSDNRVLAYGEHPKVLRFPCLIDTELDINYWGNSDLLTSEDNYLSFVEYVDYDYILIWRGFIQIDSNSYGNIQSLFENGKISDLIEENGHILLELGESDYTKSLELKQQFEIIIEENSSKAQIE